MQTVLSILIIFIWMLVIPAAVGVLPCALLRKEKYSLPFVWVSGQILLWAFFQLVSVPAILKQEQILEMLDIPAFRVLVAGYGVVSALLAAAGALVWLHCCCKKGWAQRRNRAERSGAPVLRCVFAALLLLQLVMAVFTTYRDEDDAFYVAIATITEESNGMFEKPPYTGGFTQLDARHGLAPFSIWMAFLARVSGIPAVSVAHICVPVMSILLAYCIYYLIGERLVGSKHLSLYMVFISLMILFGNVSRYTSENFLLARSRQGKATLAGIVIPVIFYLMLEILKCVQEQQKVHLTRWILLAAAVLTGCLCSTLGSVLVCVLLGLTGLCSALCYKRPLLILSFGLCCLPAVCYAAMYLLLK